MQEEKQQRRGSDQLDNHWHLDKRVPLSIIVALILQSIYFTIFLTKLDGRVGVLEKDSVEVHRVIKNMAEIRIHQRYMADKLDKIDEFLRDDIEWVKPKRKRK